MTPKTKPEVLVNAIAEDKVEIVRRWLNNGGDVDTIIYEGWPLLMHSIRHKRLEIIKLLIARGASTNIAATSDGRTPLMQCVEKEDLELTKYLIDMNANTCKPSQNGTTPLSWAALLGNVKMMHLLLSNGAKFSINNKVLFKSIRNGNDEVTKLLVQNCPDINIKDADGDTLLIKSVRLEKFSKVKLLMQQGADVNQKDKNGLTALAIALSNFDFRTFQVLVESGADLNLAIKEIEEMAQKNEGFAAYIESLKSENKNTKLTGTTSVKPKALVTGSLKCSSCRKEITGQEAASKG